MTATAAYRIKGTTDDVTTCDACGRARLRKTVILAALDIDGNEEAVTYFGTDCASRALGRRETAIRNEAAAADRQRARDVEWATDFVAVYGPAEGNKRETAILFFERNPHARTKVTASEWVGEHLTKARAILAA